MSESGIDIPYNFITRDYQDPLWDFITDGGLRAFSLWHRRAGKDKTLFNLMIKQSQKEREIGLYYYFLPTYTQGKKIIWDGIDNDGFRFIDHAPDDICKSKNSQELKIDFKNGSIVQIIGTDNFDAIRGTNPRGCVFSEYAFQNPMAWEVVKPILKVNGGWAAFNTTPNGKNHAYDLWNMAKKSDDWFTEMLTIDDTGILTQKDMDEERADGMTEEMIQQEYYCSFKVGMLGAYYSRWLEDIEKEGRKTDLELETSFPVDVVMDLGKNDTTALIFFQCINNKIHIIDCYEQNGEDIPHYAEIMKEKGYNYRYVYLPHDAYASRQGSPRTIAQQFRQAGQPNHWQIRKVRSMSRRDGISLARSVFPICLFDTEFTAELWRALENYSKEYDPEKKTFRDVPKHDWASNFADAFRYLAIGVVQDKSVVVKSKVEFPFDVQKTASFVGEDAAAVFKKRRRRL